MELPLVEGSPSAPPGPDEIVRLKVLLAYCPQSHPPTAPNPAIAYLKGYLCSALPHTEVTIKDLNACYFAHIFSEQELSRSLPPVDAQRTRAAYRSQQDLTFYKDIPAFLAHHQTLEETLDRLNEAHSRKHSLRQESLRLRGNTFTYVSEFVADSRGGVLQAIAPENREKNIFYSYFSDVVVPHIARERYDVVGLSVYVTDQLVPTFLLASLIKQRIPAAKVALGGNYVSRFGDLLGTNDAINRELFRHIDALVLREGERPLVRLLQRWQDGKDAKGLNQVISTGRDGHVSGTLDESALLSLDMDTAPRPDFDGIFTDLDGKTRVYWTPTDVISLYTQRGCAYAKGCDFCTIMSANNKENSRVIRSASKVAEDMAFYEDRHRTSVFSFGNETLGKEYMIAIADELSRRGIEATIDGYTRTDQLVVKNADSMHIDLEAVRRIAPYFRFLQIGIENTDDSTLASMRKGRNSVSDSEIVRTLFEHGIMPHAFLISGFPPEKPLASRDEYINFYVRSSLATLRWLEQSKEFIGTYKGTRLALPRDNRKILREAPSGHEVAPRYAHELRLTRERDLKINLPYEKVHGSTELDWRFVEAMDLLITPYRAFSHAGIYHQRLFNWKEAIGWSRARPELARNRPDSERERRVLHRLWSEAVGAEYTKALAELERQGTSSEKRKRLEATLARSRASNIMAAWFPSEPPKTTEDILQINEV